MPGGLFLSAAPARFTGGLALFVCGYCSILWQKFIRI